jgi:hypothetical protein
MRGAVQACFGADGAVAWLVGQVEAKPGVDLGLVGRVGVFEHAQKVS